ncbi:hypothetical protein BsWGS_07948 [Bradybaena similaris]
MPGNLAGKEEINMSLVKCPMCSTSHLPLQGNLRGGTYACTCENCGHFFKFKAVGELKASITLTINGQSYDVGNEHNPATSLLEFMRQVGISRGTKGCCFEGGCGVCLVTVKFLDPLTSKPRLYTINSCCLQLYTCDGLEITTIEGLGDTRDGLHPIQDRLAKFDGAQCGFCTPGQIMNMYGLLQSNPKPTMQEVEDTFDATICRCTGYRSILDAMKSFAVDAPPSLSEKGGVIDIEELNGKLCKRTGQACRGHCGGRGNNGKIRSCDNDGPRALHLVYDQAQWFKPLTLAELTPLLKQYAGQNYRLVYGNTGFGVYGEVGPWNFSILIDIRGVQELYTVDLTPSDHITFGANVSLTALKEAFEATTDPGLPYAKAFVTHLGLTASTSIRNLSSWAGNLALKNLHKDFASDVYTLLETVGTQLTIADGDGVSKQYSLLDFLSVDLKGKVIVSMTLPKYSTSDVIIRTEKTSHRLQLCHAHVTSGFNFQVDTANNYLVKAKPTIVIQGINGQLVHAVQTEGFLVNKNLGDPAVLQNALTILSGEIVPDSGPVLASPTYRKSLAIGHFYKFALGVCQSKCSTRFASGGLDLVRPVMTGTQDYGTSDPTVFPATKPMMKLTAFNLTTGEIRFVADLAPRQGQLFAAPVLSTQGNAKIQSIDASLALQIPGVVKFIQASDIPGVNDWRPHGLTSPNLKQELLCTGQVLYAGQPIGILLAEDEVTAQSSRYGVQITYTDIQPALTDVEEAIQQKSFFTKSNPITRGDATAAMAAAPHRVSGTVRCTDQYNFHLENQASLCVPTDTGGMDVMTTTQWQDPVIEAISQVLGIPEAMITVETQRLGGGFGGKGTYNIPVAGMCAVAAYVTKRPVLMNLDLHTNMQYQGKRTLFVFEYEVGFDDNGKMAAIITTVYADVGALNFSYGNEGTTGHIDNVYNCPNWSFSVQLVKTNKPVSTPVRAPGSAPAIFGMECMIDHVATYLRKDHLAVRKINFMHDGDMTLQGVLLENCLISELVAQLEADIKIADRVQAVNDFNKNNRWKKRGFHVMPNKYAMGWSRKFYASSLYVNHGDGSVHICHGGIDMGQGINTKVIQCCAYKLGIPLNQIFVKPTSTMVNTNSKVSAGSTTTDIICLSILKLCEDLLQRMAPSKAKLTNPTWLDIVHQCYDDMVDLRAHYLPQIVDKYPAHYVVWGACAVEVELDVLTGHYQISQVDYLNDTGTSLNPELDIGQLEGGFIMGCGLFLLESMKFDPVTGQALSDGTWEYKPPLGKDLPIKFNAKLMRNVPNPSGVLGSKIVGEVPVSTGACVLFALKRAVEAARAEQNNYDWFPFHAPATVESIQTACLNDISQYTFGS